MSIQKKSLISSLKTTKKANVASSPAGEIKKGEKVESLKMRVPKAGAIRLRSMKEVRARASVHTKAPVR